MPWSFGREASRVFTEYGQKHIKCYDYKSCFGFQFIHTNYFVHSHYFEKNNLEHFPRTPDILAKVVDVSDQAIYHTYKDPSMLFNFDYFAVARDAAAEFNRFDRNLRAASTGPGAWEQGHDVDPSGEDGSPSRGAVCRTMEYFDFKPTMIEKWDCLAKMEHPHGIHFCG